MHVIWKRPDGFHRAEPTDFRVVDVGNHSRIWLHKTDNSNFPFRISGGWQESEATQRLNNMVNLIGASSNDWAELLARIYHDSIGDDPTRFYDETVRWIADLRSHLKGDTWEVEIMSETLGVIADHLQKARDLYLVKASS